MPKSDATHPEFAARLREAREAAGYDTAAAFWRALGPGHGDQNGYYRYEAGRQMPSLQMAVRIAQVAGVSLQWLATGESAELEAFERWLSTPAGQSASPEARRFLASLPVTGYEPDPLFYDLALIAYERGLRGREAADAAAQTRAATRDAAKTADT